jgi:phage shock protein PspC (stress-responsive transcriptional regulator)
MRLHRSVYNSRIGGVCGGIAETYDIDPIITRLIALLLLFFTGIGLLAYIILWFILPLGLDD